MSDRAVVSLGAGQSEKRRVQMLPLRFGHQRRLHFFSIDSFTAPAPVAALSMTMPAATRLLIPASCRAHRFVSGDVALGAELLTPVAAQADEHLAPASGTEKQSSIVHRSPWRGGLDDLLSPGYTALGAVRKCGSGRSLGRDRQVNVVRGCAVSSPCPI